MAILGFEEHLVAELIAQEEGFEMGTRSTTRCSSNWVPVLEADDQPDLHSFAIGIRRDHDAVTAGLTLPYSSGKVEGNVNRLLR